MIKRIKAKCYSDDHNVEVSFDATTWFSKASEKNILDLAGCGWGGDYPADVVAENEAERNPQIAKMFTYLEIIHGDPSKKNCQGFECHVDKDDALAWLKANRKEIYKKVLKVF